MQWTIIPSRGKGSRNVMEPIISSDCTGVDLGGPGDSNNPSG